MDSKLTLSYMRFWAALFITNSHIGPLYPPQLQFLSTGGALGNSLFFFCSGFALYLSNRNSGFYPWIVRRFTRIYPCLWLFMSINTLFGREHYHFTDIIIPTFWFLKAILLFYILFFFTIKFFEQHLKAVCFILLIPFLITYFQVPHSQWIIENTENNHFIHWYFYYIIMLTGAITSRNSIQTGEKEKCATKKTFIMIISIMIGYYGLKIYILHTLNPVFDLQLCIPLFLILFAKYFLRLSQWAIVRLKPTASYFIFFISNLTLEIYIVQFVIMAYFKQYNFPIGFITSLFTILLAARILNLISTHLINAARKLLLSKERC